MPLSVPCQCGARVFVADERIGHPNRCSMCGAPVVTTRAIPQRGQTTGQAISEVAGSLLAAIGWIVGAVIVIGWLILGGIFAVEGLLVLWRQHTRTEEPTAIGSVIIAVIVAQPFITGLIYVAIRRAMPDGR